MGILRKQMDVIIHSHELRIRDDIPGAEAHGKAVYHRKYNVHRQPHTRRSDEEPSPEIILPSFPISLHAFSFFSHPLICLSLCCIHYTKMQKPGTGIFLGHGKEILYIFRKRIYPKWALLYNKKRKPKYTFQTLSWYRIKGTACDVQSIRTRSNRILCIVY